MEMSLPKTDTNIKNEDNIKISSETAFIDNVKSSSFNAQMITDRDETFKRILDKLHIAYENLTPVIDEIINNASSFTISKLQELEHSNSPICSVTQEQYSRAIKASMLIQEVNNEVFQNSHDQKNLINGEIIHFPVADLIKTAQNSVYPEADYHSTATHRIYIKRQLVEQFIKLYKLIHKVLQQLYHIAKHKPINAKRAIIKSNNDIIRRDHKSSSYLNHSNTSRDINSPGYLERLAKLEKEYESLSDSVKILKSFIQDTSTGSTDDIRHVDKNNKDVRQIKSTNLELDSEKTKKITDISGARRCILDCLFELAEARKYIKSISCAKTLDTGNKIQLTEYPQQCCKRQDVPHLHAKLNGVAVVLKLNKETVDTILSSVQLNCRNCINEDNWSIECNKTTHNCTHSKTTTIKTTNQSTKSVSSDSTYSSSKFKEGGNINTLTHPTPVKEHTCFYHPVNEETIEMLNTLNKGFNKSLINNQELVNPFSSKNSQAISTLSMKTSSQNHVSIDLESITPHTVKNKHYAIGRPMKYQNHLKVKRSVSSPELSVRSIEDFCSANVGHRININKPLVPEINQQESMQTNNSSSPEKKDECEETDKCHISEKQIRTADLNSTCETIMSAAIVQKKSLKSKVVEAKINKKLCKKTVRIISPTDSNIKIIESYFDFNAASSPFVDKTSNIKGIIDKRFDHTIPYSVGSKFTLDEKDICSSQVAKINFPLESHYICNTNKTDRSSQVDNLKFLSLLPAPVLDKTDVIKGTLLRRNNNKNVNYNFNLKRCYSRLDYYANLSEKRIEKNSRDAYEVRYFELKDKSPENNSAKKASNSTNENSGIVNHNERVTNQPFPMAGVSNPQRIYKAYMAKSKYYNYPDEDMGPPRRISADPNQPGVSSGTPTKIPSETGGHGHSSLAIQPWAPFVTSDISLPQFYSKDDDETKDDVSSAAVEISKKSKPEVPPKTSTKMRSGTIPIKTAEPRLQQEGPNFLSNGLLLLQPTEKHLQGEFQYAVLLNPSQVNAQAIRTIGTDMINKTYAEKSTKCGDDCLFLQNMMPQCCGVQTGAVQKQNQCSQAYFPCATCSKKKQNACTQVGEHTPEQTSYLKQQPASIKVKFSTSGLVQDTCRSESFTDCYKSNKFNNYNLVQDKYDNQRKITINQTTESTKQQICNQLHHSCKDRQHPNAAINLPSVQKPCCPILSQRQPNQIDTTCIHRKILDPHEKSAPNKNCIKYNNYHHPHIHYCFVDKDKNNTLLLNNSETNNNFLENQYQQSVDQKDTESLSNKSSEQSQLIKNLKITITTNKCATVDSSTQYDFTTPYHSDHSDNQQVKEDNNSMHHITAVRYSLLAKPDMFHVQETSKNVVIDLSNNQGIADGHKYDSHFGPKLIINSNDKDISDITDLRNTSSAKYADVLDADVNKHTYPADSSMHFTEQLEQPQIHLSTKPNFSKYRNSHRPPDENLAVTNDSNQTFVTQKKEPLTRQNGNQATYIPSQQQKPIAHKHSRKENVKSKTPVSINEMKKDEKPLKPFDNGVQTEYVTIKNLRVAGSQKFVKEGNSMQPQFSSFKEKVNGNKQARSRYKHSHKKQKSFVDIRTTDSILFDNQIDKELKHHQRFTNQQLRQIHRDTHCADSGSVDNYTVQRTTNEDYKLNQFSDQTHVLARTISKDCENHTMNSRRKEHVTVPSHHIEIINKTTSHQSEIKPYLIFKNCNAINSTSAIAETRQCENGSTTSRQSNSVRHHHKPRQCSISKQLLSSSTAFQTTERNGSLQSHSSQSTNCDNQFLQDVKKEIELTCKLDSSKYSIKVSQLTDAATSTEAVTPQVSKNKMIEYNENFNKNKQVHVCKRNRRRASAPDDINFKQEYSYTYCKSTQLPPIVYRSKSFLETTKNAVQSQIPRNSVGVQITQNTQKLFTGNGRTTQSSNTTQQTNESNKFFKQERNKLGSIHKCRKCIDKSILSHSIECIICQACKIILQPVLKSISNSESTFLLAKNDNYSKDYINQLFSGNQLTLERLSTICNNIKLSWIPSDYDKNEFDVYSSLKRYQKDEPDATINDMDFNLYEKKLHGNQIEDTYCVHSPEANAFTASLTNNLKGDSDSNYVPSPFGSNHSIYESFQYEINPDVEEGDYLPVTCHVHISTSSDEDSITSARQSKLHPMKNQVAVEQLVQTEVYGKESCLAEMHSERQLKHVETEHNEKQSAKIIQQNTYVQPDRSCEVRYSESQESTEMNAVDNGSKSTVCWALTKVKLNSNGTQDIEILETSPIPPGHFLIPSANSVILLGNQPYIYSAQK